jgi:hypothetical protein
MDRSDPAWLPLALATAPPINNFLLPWYRLNGMARQNPSPQSSGKLTLGEGTVGLGAERAIAQSKAATSLAQEEWWSETQAFFDRQRERMRTPVSPSDHQRDRGFPEPPARKELRDVLHQRNVSEAAVRRQGVSDARKESRRRTSRLRAARQQAISNTMLTFAAHESYARVPATTAASPSLPHNGRQATHDVASNLHCARAASAKVMRQRTQSQQDAQLAEREAAIQAKRENVRELQARRQHERQHAEEDRERQLQRKQKLELAETQWLASRKDTR